jgi:hypothetical protein
MAEGFYGLLELTGVFMSSPVSVSPVAPSVGFGGLIGPCGLVGAEGPLVS